jgi:hypothetical protein
MERDLLDILVIGEKQQRCGQLVSALEQLGCRCWFARTAEEIREALDRRTFRLVLSTRPVPEGSALMPLLCEPKRSVFYSIPVENGCLWFRAFPEIVAGERLSAVRAGEFMKQLSDLIARLQSAKRPIPLSARTPVFNRDAHSARGIRGGKDEDTTLRSI